MGRKRNTHEEVEKQKKRILKCLETGPKSATEIMNELKIEIIPSRKVSKFSQIYLDSLKKEYRIYSLERSNKNRNFLKIFYSKQWNNKFHTYYFSTPKTAKWEKILDEVVIREIINNLGRYLNHVEDIKQTLKDLIKTIWKIETLPIYRNTQTKKQRKKDIEKEFNKEIQEIQEGGHPLYKTKEGIEKAIKEQKELKESFLWGLEIPTKKQKSITREEFIERGKNMFGFDVIEYDFTSHLRNFKENQMDITFPLARDLRVYQERLHKLLFLQEIKIKNILEFEFNKKSSSKLLDLFY